MFFKGQISQIIGSLLIVLSTQWAKAQEDVPSDTLLASPVDTVNALQTDTIQRPKKKTGGFLDDEINYKAKDSIIFDPVNRYMYLYGEASVVYQDIDLKAAYIKVDMENEEVYAEGRTDTAGMIIGEPVFKQGEEEFESKGLTYNFNTKKGYITELYSEQQEGYIHSAQTKRLPDGKINMKGGKFTTCDLHNPHFYIGLRKGIVIPNDKIISGPAYIVIEDIPLPFFIPFGYFPTSSTASSGVIIPSYGEEERRGFFLQQGGWYFPIGEHADLKILGDVYSKGTWGLTAMSRYKLRYKFSGNLSMRYYENKLGEEYIDQTVSKDFSVRWSHRQDPKANPTSNFSANVNFSTRSFDQNHSYSVNERLQNTKSSSINYSKNWPGTPFNLSGSMNHSQNSNTGDVNLTLPSLSFSMSRIYPFRSKNFSGKPKWYQNIQLSYRSDFSNEIKTKDSLLLKTPIKQWDKAYRHSIPLSVSFKFLKFFNFSPSMSYDGMVYFNKQEILFDSEAEEGEDQRYDTIYHPGIYYTHGYAPRASLSASPKIYGMYTFRNSRVKALRHMVMPSASVSYAPDMKNLVPDYYRMVRDESTGVVDTLSNGEPRYYGIYDSEKYGTPTARGRSGSVSLSLRNNLEMKIMRSDTADEPEKVKILDNFDLSTNYNPFAPEFKWSTIKFNTRTSLFENKLTLQYNATIDPYTYDKETLRRIPVFEYKETGRIGRVTSTRLSAGLRLRSAQGGKRKDGEVPITEYTDVDEFGNPMGRGWGPAYVDFSIPWRFNLDYSFNTSYTGDEKRLDQTLRINGDISLTDKWKVIYRTGYDFKAEDFTQSSLTITRNLHCWQMSLNIVPFGTYQSYTFNINVTSSILQDLKWKKRESWYDR